MQRVSNERLPNPAPLPNKTCVATRITQNAKSEEATRVEGGVNSPHVKFGWETFELDGIIKHIVIQLAGFTRLEKNAVPLRSHFSTAT